MEDLYNFMIWGDYNQRISELAAMAIPEPWSFADRNDNSILKNYMTYTFERLKEENKVLITDDICLFNTGLFTPYYESIYVYADNKGVDDDQYWKFKRFLTDYDVGSLGIKNSPQRADYFGDPSLLVFNCNYPINVQYRHILEDTENLRRLPESITNSNIPINNNSTDIKEENND